MKDPISESISKLKETLKDLSEACINGVDSWDKYNQLVGQARGIKDALDIINNVLREDEED